MKHLFLSILVLATTPAFAASSAFPGAWLDIDAEANFAAYEKSGDLKTFCGSAYYQGEDIDSILTIQADGRIQLCKLNVTQSTPLGAACKDFGVADGEALEIHYADGSSVTGAGKLLEPGHIQVELKHPAQGQYVPVEMWDLKQLTDARVNALSAAYLACARQ